MNVASTYLSLFILVMGAVGWLMSIAPRMEGRVRALLTAMIGVFALSTATQGFGVGGVGAEFPGWQQVGQLGKALLYATLIFLLLIQHLRQRPLEIMTWSHLALYSLALVVAGWFGTVPSYNETLLFPLYLSLIGALGSQYVERTLLLKITRTCLLWICAGSVLYLALAPSLATSEPNEELYAFGGAQAYQASVIGIGLRLHGLTSHANTLGYVAAVALLLGLYPKLRMRCEWWWQIIALICLVLAQSKTMWVAIAVALAVRQLGQLEGLSSVRRSLTIMVLLGIIGTGLVGLLIYAPQLNPSDLTLTGRTSIWALTIAEFQHNWLAGYGPGLWNEEYRLAQGYTWAGQSHNQAIQTLGQAGLLGGVALLTLIISLWRRAWLSRQVTNGTSIALVTVLILRGISETPLRFGLDIEALIVLAIFLVATVRSNHISDRP